ncbi:MAG: hypothetical protein KF725_01220 [Cyclobacteriaceae bacterium]|nr:hypothetical protein [Cyclobacteriaceae bacterium]UYN86925.1 MAG: hypothetical protein KIT51_01185 [Cyclobacteriaceae bacterium]
MNRSKPQNPKKKPKARKKKAEKPEEETDNPFDFGGLPQRDLKKNLGCG